MALFFPLFAFLMFMTPINESLIGFNTQIRDLARLDKKMGDDVEYISSCLNSALALNAALIALYVMCPAGTVTQTASALKIKGELVRFQQEFFLYQAQLRIELLPQTQFSTDFNRPKRNSPSVCEIPGTLYCPENTLFMLKNRDGAKPAGVKGESSTCATVRWKYSDARVRPL